MKILIVYYSYSGKTKKVIDMLEPILRKAGEVDTQRLIPEKETTSFVSQCLAARFRKRCELKGDVIYNISPYDMLVIASPVWALAPTPAINTYLDKVIGGSGKNCISLLTSGSGAGVSDCFKNMREALTKNGFSDIKEINIPNKKMKDAEFIDSTLSRLI